MASVHPQLQRLSDVTEKYPETLATGNSEIQVAALAAAKHIFDLSIQSESISRQHINELIQSLSPCSAPQTRSRASSTKNVSAQNIHVFESTPIDSLIVDDMDDEQLWTQLDLRTQTICRMLDFILEGEGLDPEEPDESVEKHEQLFNSLDSMVGDGDHTLEDMLSEYELGDQDEVHSSDEDFDELDDSGEESSGLSEDSEHGEGISPLRDISEVSEDKRVFSSALRKRKSSEIDDDFFSLAEFNVETERAEARSSSKGALAGDSDEEDMEVDLFTPMEGTEGWNSNVDNPQELFYADFFEPPHRTATSRPSETSGRSSVRFHEEVRVKRIKATGKTRPLNGDEGDEDEDDTPYLHDIDHEMSSDEDANLDVRGTAGGQRLQGEDEDDDSEDGSRAVGQRVQHDLFQDEEEEPNDLTRHQKRMVALNQTITEMETENVAHKDWMMIGEAGSRQRPQNSLLEEDLEFDRVMKAVPTITEEAVRTLEDTIKSRIIDRNFDDVIRVRVHTENAFQPSKFLELQDSKSKQSLAQIYEHDYISSQTEGAAADDRDGKLQKQHEELTELWERLCAKLDALSNAHFVPKLPKATITTIVNTSTTSLESQLPTSKSASTLLAPEEVFSANPASLTARSEMTTKEKKSLRLKERKLRKKKRDTLNERADKVSKINGIGRVKKQKQAALESLVKRGKGVTVVGKMSGNRNKGKTK